MRKWKIVTPFIVAVDAALYGFVMRGYAVRHAVDHATRFGVIHGVIFAVCFPMVVLGLRRLLR